MPHPERRPSLLFWLLVPIALAAIAGLYAELFRPTPPAASPAPPTPSDGPQPQSVCGLLTPVSDAETASADRAERLLAQPHGFSGSWRTNYGPLRLFERASGVTGHYEQGSDIGLIEGQVEADGRLRFVWREDGGKRKGRGGFELADAGARITGHFGYHSKSEGGGQWFGTRENTGWRPKTPQPGVLEGLWDTEWGPVEIARDGASADGCYRYTDSGNTVTGRFEGWFDAHALYFHWLEADETTREERRGEGVFWLSAEDTLEGVWGFGRSRRSGGMWKGTRAQGHWTRRPL